MPKTKTPLEKVADAFTELAALVNSPNPNIPVIKFSKACSLFSSLYGILEKSFKFAKMDFGGKIKDLAKASESISTLEVMVDKDIKDNSVKKVDSHTRNLMKVTRGLEMIKVLCDDLLATKGELSLNDSALKAYKQVLLPYHGYSVKQACLSGLDALPSMALVLPMIGETEKTVKPHMQSFVTASAPVIAYLDKLFLSKNLGIDW